MPDTTLHLVETVGGTRLRLRVMPSARRNAILGVHAGALKVSVTAPPERGKANRAVLDLLAEVLGVPASTLEITSGSTSREKSVLVQLPPGKVEECLRGTLRG